MKRNGRIAAAALMLCVSAGLTGAADAPADRVVVSVDGQPITQADVYGAAAQYFPQQMRTVVDRLIDRILIVREAQRRAVKVTAEEVRRRAAATGSGGALSAAAAADIEAVLLAEKMVQRDAKITVTDAEIQRYFEASRQRLEQPVRVQLRHVVLAGRAEADDMLFALQAGADFAKMAGAKSRNRETGARGGDIGPMSPEQLAPEIRRAIAPLKEGGLSQVVSLADGYHIFKVEKNLPAQPAVLDAGMKTAIRDAVRSQKINDGVSLLLQELRKKAVVK